MSVCGWQENEKSLLQNDTDIERTITSERAWEGELIAY